MPISRVSTTTSRRGSASSSTGRSSKRATDGRSPTRWLSSGRPTRQGATCTRATSTFITIQPGAYPWGNHDNAWRPAHIHFSIFGRAFVQRLVTQMYFPGDPLFFQDPIFNSVPDPKARERMICRFDLEQTVPEWALAFHFDIVLRGREATPMEEPH
jgi:protocatechuate 3,4-dioxygenase beta subunit